MATKYAQRKSEPVNVWQRQLDPIRYGDEEWRITALRGGGKPTLYLDDIVESFDWQEDSKHVLTGTLSLRKPPGRKIDLQVGAEIRVEWAHRGSNRWREAWRMRLDQPSVEIRDAVTTYQLTDDLVRLTRSQGDYKYRHDKAHPKGWTGTQVIQHLADREGFRVVALPRMTHRIKKVVMTNVEPLAVITRVLRIEREATGKRFFIRWQNGGLAILPYQRSRELLVMAGHIITGTYAETLPEGFATELEVVASKTDNKGKDAKGHHKKKKRRLHRTVSSPKMIARYGRIHRKIVAPEREADSVAELLAYGRRRLARIAKPDREFSFDHPGIVTLRRGHAVRLTVEDVGLLRDIVYVSEVSHSVSAGDYTMNVTVQFEDPFVTARHDRTSKQRATKARERARKADGSAPTSYPRPRKAAQREAQLPSGVSVHRAGQ